MDTIHDPLTDNTATSSTSSTPSLRDRATRRIRNRREFHRHLVVYLLVNALVVAIWAMTTPGGFFWPIFLIAAWGIGLVMHGWDAYADSDISDAEIDREIARLKGR